MAITFNQFFNAIVEQESGGNYHAIGPQTSYGHAYGKYQVLGSNIPGWTKKYYGKSLTPQQFLNNKAAQDAVAKGVLKSYFDRYGPRGAAAAWYGGPGSAHLDQSTAPQQGGPSIKGYVDNVMKNALKYPATGGVSKNSGGGGGGGAPAPKDYKSTAEKYGFTVGFLQANPEIKKLFDHVVKDGWTFEKFQAELRGTKWWKTHSQQEKDYLTKLYADPATAKASYNAAYTHVQQLASQLGVQLNDQTKKFLNAMAYNVAAKGWNDDQLRAEMGKHVYFDGDNWNGQGGEAIAKLKNYAYSMGVTMATSWYTNGARDIVRGMGTEQDYESQIRKAAKAQFPQWSKQIDAGQTVMDLANPYLTSMTQILELPGGSINLFDPTIKKALNYKSPTGESQAKPLWQFENELRADPRWKKTQNAQDSLMQVGHQVLADFGFKY